MQKSSLAKGQFFPEIWPKIDYVTHKFVCSDFETFSIYHVIVALLADIFLFCFGNYEIYKRCISTENRTELCYV